MKCIYKENVYYGNDHCRSTLMGQDKAGNASPLLDRLTLTVGLGAGYRITNVHGEIIRQGAASNVFEIVDSLPFTYDRNAINVHTADFAGTFAEYEAKYGHGRVERLKARRFKATAVTNDVIDVNGQVIHVQDGQAPGTVVADYVQGLLNANQIAHVTAEGLNVGELPLRFHGVVRMWEVALA